MTSTTPEPPAIDLRILTPGLDEEEIAAVTSVVRAVVTARRSSPSGEAIEAANARRWRRAVAPIAAEQDPHTLHAQWGRGIG